MQWGLLRLYVQFPKEISQMRNKSWKNSWGRNGSCSQLLDIVQYKCLRNDWWEKKALQRQDSKHRIEQSSATHFCIANADIQEYSVKGKIKSSLKKLVSFLIQINLLKAAHWKLKIWSEKLVKDYFALSLVADKDKVKGYKVSRVLLYFFTVCRHFIVTSTRSRWRKRTKL